MMSREKNTKEKVGRPPTLIEAVIVIGIAAILIAMAVRYWETDVHIALVLSATVASVVALFVLKYPWSVIEEGVLASIMMGMQAMLILFTVGILIGTWLLSGFTRNGV